MVRSALTFFAERVNALTALVGLGLIAAGAFSIRTDVGLFVLGVELVAPVVIAMRGAR